MKISSSKPESQSQVSSSPDSSAVQASDSPMDIIFAMLMQAAAGVMPQTDNSDIQDVPDASDKSLTSDDGTIQQTMDSSSVENNPLFQQINLASTGSTDVQSSNNQSVATQQQISAATTQMQTQASSQANVLDQTKNAVDLTQQNANQLVNNNVPQTNQVDATTTQSKQAADVSAIQAKQATDASALQVKQTADTSATQAKQTVDAAASQLKQVTDAMASQLKQAVDPNVVSTPTSSQAKQIATNNASTTAPATSDTVDNSLLQQLSKATSAANMNSNKVATDIKATPAKNANNDIKSENIKDNFLKIDNKIENPKVENSQLAINQKTSDDTNPDLGDDSDPSNSMLKPEQLSSVSASQANQTNQSSALTESVAQQAAQQNKYTDALVQLGSFINSQTMSMYGNNVQNNSSTAAGSANNPSVLSDYTMAALNTMPPYELKVDIMPASVDSMMKEVYDAKIRVFPPELGHIIAKLRVGDNGANLSLTTENDRVKAIVEQNLPQLKENFQNANINLTNVNVQTSSQSTVTDQQNSNNQRRNEGSLAQNFTNESNSDQLVPAKEDSKSSNTIVDTYA